MKITSSVRPDGVAVLVAEGRVNMVTAPEFRRQVQLLVNGGNARVAVDLAAVDFMDSSGLGALVSGLKTARTAGGDLRLASASEQVSSVLRLTNLDRILSMHATVDDAYRD